MRRSDKSRGGSKTLHRERCEFSLEKYYHHPDAGTNGSTDVSAGMGHNLKASGSVFIKTLDKSIRI